MLGGTCQADRRGVLHHGCNGLLVAHAHAHHHAWEGWGRAGPAAQEVRPKQFQELLMLLYCLAQTLHHVFQSLTAAVCL